MRRTRQTGRGEVLWYAAGFLLVQLALGVAIDCWWPTVRDPEFGMLEQALRDLREEAPDRPLIVALGSSRTEVGLRPALLVRAATAGAPLVFNCGIGAGGPMMDLVALRRLIDDGLRPDVVLVEAIPFFLSPRDGAPVEQDDFSTARLRADELARLLPYYESSQPPVLRWLKARLLPCLRHQAELCTALGLDRPIHAWTFGTNQQWRVNHGWRPHVFTITAEQAAARQQAALARYESALADSNIDRGVIRAYDDLLSLCQAQGIHAVLVLPPESSAFRFRHESAQAAHIAYLRELARKFDVPLYDARALVPDNGFWDGHHLLPGGADRYTQCLARDVIATNHSKPITAQLYPVSPTNLPMFPRLSLSARVNY
jgi:hypothetical protein